MDEKLLRDSLNIANQTISNLQKSHSYNNVWMWVSFFELALIILILLMKKSKRIETPKQKFKNESLANDIDFDNIIDSSFNSLELYDELKVKCHPDRFPNDIEKNNVALAIFQEVTKNKANLKRLKELKEEAKLKLDIKF